MGGKKVTSVMQKIRDWSMGGRDVTNVIRIEGSHYWALPEGG